MSLLGDSGAAMESQRNGSQPPEKKPQSEWRVSYRQGVWIEDCELWLDPARAQPWAFVSHAHADHVARHQRLLCSRETGFLLKKRYNIAADRMVMLDFCQPWCCDGWRYELLPAGHITGSAMLHLSSLDDERSLLYTGDFKMQASRTAMQAQWRHAQLLIMETTFGLPHYCFPPRRQVETELVTFVKECHQQGQTPVLLAYSLGKAQELTALLAEHQLPVVLHAAVMKMHLACQELGVSLPTATLWEDEVPAGATLIAAPQVRRHARWGRLVQPRAATVSGWALMPSHRYRHDVSAAFPLSDHADFNELLQCVALVQPEKVLTLHGSARSFAAILRRKGVAAWSIFGHDQLEFNDFFC